MPRALKTNTAQTKTRLRSLQVQIELFFCLSLLQVHPAFVKRPFTRCRPLVLHEQNCASGLSAQFEFTVRVGMVDDVPGAQGLVTEAELAGVVAPPCEDLATGTEGDDVGRSALHRR